MQYDSSKEVQLNYAGLPIYSSEGLHEEVLEKVELVVEKWKKVLVLGCGAGAFDARLLDAGYWYVTGADIHEDNYRIAKHDKYKGKTDFVKVDFNRSLKYQITEKYDAIVLIDVIEHVHSIRKFIRGLRYLLEYEGKIVIATPNIHCDESHGNAMMFGGPIAYEGIPLEYEHFSIPSAGIITASAAYEGMFIEDIDSILCRKFTPPETFGIRVLRRISVWISKLFWKLSNRHTKAKQTVISQFMPIETQEKLRDGLYLYIVISNVIG